jgi:uncharacterized repeat protein (TIGR03803 family)
MKILRISCVIVGFLCVVLSLSAQTFTTLHNFDAADGANPYAGPVQGTNGSFFGTTSAGGATGAGTAFEITSSGALAMLSFDGTDGDFPRAGLVLAGNGNLYGTTTRGGTNGGYGTVFKITSSGMLTTLHSFDGTDGEGPNAGLVQGISGNFYGTTTTGGSGCPSGCGTIFEITPSGVLTTLQNFDLTDGAASYAPLVQGTDGNFYGTTTAGGTHSFGTVFKITPAGTLTTLYSFGGPDGDYPAAALVQGADGNFYGTTVYGGTANYGTVFKITPSGTLTTLYSFNGQDGAYPWAVWIQATDGNFYGTTTQGGANGDGAIFAMTPGGALTTLHSFDSTDGTFPYGLAQATDGSFYGTTYEGGTSNACLYGCGTVYNLSVELGPFVKTVPTSGKVGAAVRILGTKLTGATSVTFNGTAVAFSVVSKSEITTTVPTGATTGNVQVTTPRGTLTSNVPFYVIP